MFFILFLSVSVVNVSIIQWRATIASTLSNFKQKKAHRSELRAITAEGKIYCSIKMGCHRQMNPLPVHAHYDPLAAGLVDALAVGIAVAAAVAAVVAAVVAIELVQALH